MPAFLRGLRSQRIGDENRACGDTKMVIVGCGDFRYIEVCL